MNQYRRKKQITDEAVNQFKDYEIEKINTLIKTPKKHDFKRVFIFSANAVALLIIALIVMRGNAPQDPVNYTLTRVDPLTYLLEINKDDQVIKLTFDTILLHRGVRTNYNEDFDYYAPFEYVSPEVRGAFEVNNTLVMSVFELDEYRYFLEIHLNDDISFIEVNFFKNQTFHHVLSSLELDDLEKDMIEIYRLIDFYPPTKLNQLFGPNYEAHPDIDQVTDLRLKALYITYVENYYKEVLEDTNQPSNITVSLNQMIVLDYEGNIVETDIGYGYCFGVCDNPFDWQNDFSFMSYFNFYEVTSPNPQPRTGFGFNGGIIRDMVLNGSDHYIHFFLELNYFEGLEDHVHYVKIIPTYQEGYINLDASFIQEIFYYNRSLIVPPILINHTFSNANNTHLDSVFQSLIVEFYTIDDELIDTKVITIS
jgi:hypothetical protein